MAYRNGYSRDDRNLDRDRDRDPRDDGKPPIHIIEHLATFSVSRSTGILYPVDGMRRLRQMEQTNGIWSQKMQICLDHPWVLILDESGSIVEKFPADSIEDPTAFMSQDPMDMYNNILVFMIADSSQSSPAEMQMHIFQCQSISAQDLVEDLKQLRMGKAFTRSRKSSIPPPAHKPPQHIVSPSRDHNRDYLMHQRSDSELTENNDDSSSTTSEKYERDVTILNHCFDDIEKFIARLQHAATALRELERKRKNRKNKKRDMGDGMLTMRSKPPPEKEFIDIFQKFKLSFNLLAKLKAHIHDPNAPELVHFLFTPLALIVEASHDHYFDQHIPQNVISPLLTREATNLLMNCVTSKETELWHSLGNAWTMPRDQYNGHVTSYHPVFMDGWSPEYPVDDPDVNDKPYTLDVKDDDSDNHFMPPVGESTAKSDISVDSIELKGEEKGFGYGQDRFLEDLLSRGAHIVQVTYPRTANNDKELTVVRGEFLEILDSSRKWWKARNSKGQVAHVPNTIVTQYHSSNMSPLHRNQHIEDSPPVRYSGQSSSNEHRVQPKPAEFIMNDRIEEKQSPPPPASVPAPPPPPIGSTAPAPPPPPPPVGDMSQPATLKRTVSRRSIQSNVSVNDAMQEELMSVLTLVRGREKSRPILDIKPTPETYIDSKSTPKDVQEWIKSKGFDENISAKFKGITGYQLFEMTKSEFMKACGEKTGNRLHSYVLVQKATSKFQTYRSAELQKMLARAREKIEPTTEL